MGNAPSQTILNLEQLLCILLCMHLFDLTRPRGMLIIFYKLICHITDTF